MAHSGRILATLILAVCVSLAIGGTPAPGFPCAKPEECNPTTTRMVCKGRDGVRTCNCDGFKAGNSPKVTPTEPHFEGGKCVVKEGDHCEIKVKGWLPPPIDCQPTTVCEVKEGETEIGICTKGGSGQGHSTNAPLLAILTAIVALLLKQ